MKKNISSKIFSAIGKSEKQISVIANIFLIISIFFGSWTFFSQRSESILNSRREAALQFSNLRHESNYSEASQVLLDALLKNDRYLIALGNQSDAKQNGATEVLREVGIGKIDGLAKFYISALSCMKEQVCDKEIINLTFKDEITFFYCSTKEYILPEIQKKLSNDESYKTLETYFSEEIKECPTGETV